MPTILQYPKDLTSEKRGGHSILFTATLPQKSKYNSAGFSIPGALNSGGWGGYDISNKAFSEVYTWFLSQPTAKPVSYIMLYMPDEINQNLRAKYNNLSATKALGALGVTAEAMKQGESLYEKMKNSGGVTQALDTLSTNIPPGTLEYIGKKVTDVGMAGPGMSDLMLGKAGYALNPQYEVLFTEIDFRTFQFTFSFTPKDEGEAKTIREIIKTFRFHASPELDENGAGRYFIVPSIFNIAYLFNGKENPNLHKFTTCVLKTIIVDYASEVGWVSYDDGMPVKTVMRLLFQETEILHKNKIMEGF